MRTKRIDKKQNEGNTLAHILLELPSFFVGYYMERHRQGKIGLKKFFWLMFFISITSMLLFGLLVKYEYVLGHWERVLMILMGGNFVLAAFATAMAWWYKRQSTKASQKNNAPAVVDEIKPEA